MDACARGPILLLYARVRYAPAVRTHAPQNFFIFLFLGSRLARDLCVYLHCKKREKIHTMNYLRYSLATLLMITGTIALSIMVTINTQIEFGTATMNEFIFMAAVFFTCCISSMQIIKSVD